MTGQHLEQDVAEGPRVNRQSLLFLVDHLGGLIVHSSYEGASPQLRHGLRIAIIILIVQFLVDFPSVAKVYYLYVVVLVKHDI